MEVITTFVIGRMLFSFVDRYDVRYVVFELIFLGLFIAMAAFFLSVSNVPGRALSIGVTFLLTGIAPHLIARRHAGVKQIKNPDRQTVLGIIEFAWLAIMGAVLSIIELIRAMSPLADPIPSLGSKPDYYFKLYDQTVFWLGKVIDGVPIMGVVLGACMTILWAGEIWRKDSGSALVQYKATTKSAIKMIIAFLVTVFGFIYYLGLPLYERMNAITNLLK